MLPRRKRRKPREIDPDEILIDAQNPGDFDTDRFEGRIERPLSRKSFVFVAALMACAFLFFISRAGMLQIVRGAAYAKQAEENQLVEKAVIADRGTIEDRNGVPLAYNERDTINDEFAKRMYSLYRGISHVVGYVKPPAKDSSGVYYREIFEGLDGIELAYDTELKGVNGEKLTETNARGVVVSESTQTPPTPGAQLRLSLDAKVTEGLYDTISKIAQQSGFKGGAGVIMDIHTGELLALTSYPEYSSQALTNGDTQAIKDLNSNKQQPFLNRAVDGLYSPGSIVKPVMSIAALTEGVIDEYTQILSTGSISVPNPYDKTRPSIFKDWKAHGYVDARRAIAVSSDVYFYEVGGGFQGQPGIGIEKIDAYLRMFGFGSATGLFGFTEPTGVISSVEWKAKTFPNDPWRVGDTYNTAIGQYGTQITPLQGVRMIAAVANSGKLLTPTLIASSTPVFTKFNLPEHYFDVAREGMRMSTTEGTSAAVNFGFVHVAGKTGTAQVGVKNEFLNSWIVGFWPYENPKYAFAVVMDRGPAGTVVGAPAAAGQFLLWMNEHAPQYLK